MVSSFNVTSEVLKSSVLGVPFNTFVAHLGEGLNNEVTKFAAQGDYLE